MKVITLYQCETCGKKHEKEHDCIKCEKTHTLPDHLLNAEYFPFYQYPHSITVAFKDGLKLRYEIEDEDK